MRNKLLKQALGSFFFGVLMLVFVFTNTHIATAITTHDLQSLHVPFYDPNACAPGAITGVQGLEALRLQEGLDPQWVEVIGAAAQEKGVDPIFMAGLLWVENRGYPEYKSSGWHVSPSSGTGPWAIIQSVWPAAAGDYTTGAQDPVIATPVAAELIKNMGGGTSSLPMGSIRDDFSRGNNLQTVAALGKNYNAGGATWREPGVAGHKDPGRTWMKPNGAWSAKKNIIIDNYIVIFQHVYYHIATGQQIPSLADNNVHADAALAMLDEIESYVPGGASPAPSPETTEPSNPDGERPTIVLDPGHGGPPSIDRDDPETGLHDGDYSNPVEQAQVFEVAQMVKTELEAAGYNVLLTKDSAEASMFLRDRANIANQANAALAVSIHTQGNLNFGEWQEIYVQKVGLYRGAGGNRTEFTNAEVAEKSQAYAQIMKQERDAIEVTSGTTEIKDNSFNGRPGLEPGNIPLVQLFAAVPWLYLEAGGGPASTGLTVEEKSIYAQSIAAGVKKAVPSAATQSDGCDTSPTNSGDVVATALSYAWPDYKGRGFTEKKPEYDSAITAAIDQGMYVGGCRGVDCGAFVTRVMIDSGFEPRYNYNGKGGATPTQKQWLDENWESLGSVSSTSDLQPGDAAWQPGHTFMFVGDQPGFETPIASSSLCQRAPMAGKESISGSGIVWYRKR